MIKLQIVDGSLQVSSNGTIILVAPKNSCAIDVLSLYDAIPLAVIYNKYLGTSTNIFTQLLANCVDSANVPFTVNSFIAFAEANLGFDTTSGGCGGCSTSPFEYNANATGIQPILGSNNASGTNATIGGGTNNTASGNCSTIGGGCGNTNSAYSGFVGGGKCNGASQEHAVTVGGLCNSSSSYRSIVVGGENNTASNVNSIVVGGQSNNSSSIHSFIGGGFCNQVVTTACHSIIVGGCYNCVIRGTCSFIGGGNNNYIGEVTNSGILGGINNQITNPYCNVMIVGNGIVANRGDATFVNQLSIMNIPTSNAGLVCGSVWNDLGLLRIVY